MPSLELLLGIAAGVVLVGVVAVRVSVRLGLPSLLLYLGIGIVLGESVLGIEFSDAALTE
jgi:cell volume regulation protein A